MKRTRELTSVHYRRSVKRLASLDVQNQSLQCRCPVCSTPLEAILVSEPGDSQKDRLRAQRAVLRVAQKESGEMSNEDSGK
jgi:hypothetical protein